MAAAPRLDRGSLSFGAVLGEREGDRTERERRDLAARREALLSRGPAVRRLHAVSTLEAARVYGRTRSLDQNAVERVRVAETERLVEWLETLAHEHRLPLERVITRFLDTWAAAHELTIVPGGPRGEFRLEPAQIDSGDTVDTVDTPHSSSVPTPPEVSDVGSGPGTAPGTDSPAPGPAPGSDVRPTRTRYQGPGDGSQWDAPLGDPTDGGH